MGVFILPKILLRCNWSVVELNVCIDFMMVVVVASLDGSDHGHVPFTQTVKDPDHTSPSQFSFNLFFAVCIVYLPYQLQNGLLCLRAMKPQGQVGLYFLPIPPIPCPQCGVSARFPSPHTFDGASQSPNHFLVPFF